MLVISNLNASMPQRLKHYENNSPRIIVYEEVWVTTPNRYGVYWVTGKFSVPFMIKMKKLDLPSVTQK